MRVTAPPSTVAVEIPVEVGLNPRPDGGVNGAGFTTVGIVLAEVLDVVSDVTAEDD